MNDIGVTRVRQRSPLLVAGVIALSLAVMVGCSSSKKSGSGSSGGSKSPYVIGMDEDLSGVLAFEGNPDKAGVETAFDQVNASGGVNGKQIKLIAIDNASDPAKGATAYTQLAGDKALGVMGFVNSATLVGAMPLAKSSSEGSRPILLALGGPDNLLFPPVEYHFNYGLVPSDEADMEVTYLHTLAQREGLSSAKIAVLAADASSTQDFVKQIKSSASRYPGWSVVDTQLMPISVTDVTAQALKIARDKPDFVIVFHNDSGALVADAGLRNAGVNVPIINAHTSPPALEKMADPKYYTVNAFLDPSLTNVAAVKAMDDVASKYGQSKQAQGEYFTTGYVAGKLVAAALKACGASCTPPQFSKALESIRSLNTNGLSGPIGLSASNHSAVNYGLVLQYDATTKRVTQIPGYIKTTVSRPTG